MDKKFAENTPVLAPNFKCLSWKIFEIGTSNIQKRALDKTQHLNKFARKTVNKLQYIRTSCLQLPISESRYKYKPVPRKPFACKMVEQIN